MFIKVFLLFTLFAFAYGQRFEVGPCPTIEPAGSFDKSTFFGHWVETEKTPSFFDLFMRCMELDFSDDNDGSINVLVKGQSVAGLPISVAGDGIMQNIKKAGQYNVRYILGVPLLNTQTTVVDMDREYSLVYSCTNSFLNVFHTEYIWLLTRDGVLSNPSRQNIYEKLDKLGINRSGLQLSDRAGCPTNITREAVLISDITSLLNSPIPGTLSTPLPVSSSSTAGKP